MRLALLATLSTSLLAAACADDSHDSATFATATDTQLLRVADVARFRDAGLMFEVADALFGANSAGCPAVSTTGQVTTVTTDCTTDNGWTVSGKLVITNFGFDSEPARDPAQPSTIEAFDLRASRGADLQTMDGVVEVRIDSTVEESGFRITAALDLADSNLRAHTDGTFACDADQRCHYEDAWIGVDTLGEAAIDGASIPSDGGSITLVGHDTLVFATERDPNGCFTMTIAGAPRTVCEAATQHPAPSPWLSILR